MKLPTTHKNSRFRLRRVAVGAGVLVVLVLSVMVWAADPDKTVSMVTYFPVRYAAYNNLYISKKLDVGLLKGQEFSLTLGSTDDNPSLKAKDAVIQTGALSLNMPLLVSKEAVFGKSVEGVATLTFKKNAYVKAIDNLNSGQAINSMTTPNMRVTGHASLFNSSANLPETCHGSIEWKTFSYKEGLISKTGTFLVCDEEEASEVPDLQVGSNTPTYPSAVWKRCTVTFPEKVIQGYGQIYQYEACNQAEYEMWKTTNLSSYLCDTNGIHEGDACEWSGGTKSCIVQSSARCRSQLGVSDGCNSSGSSSGTWNCSAAGTRLVCSSQDPQNGNNGECPSDTLYFTPHL